MSRNANTSFDDYFKKYGIDVKCVFNVIREVIGESKISNLWDQIKEKIDDLGNVVWQECLKITDKSEQQKLVESIRSIDDFSIHLNHY